MNRKVKPLANIHSFGWLQESAVWMGKKSMYNLDPSVELQLLHLYDFPQTNPSSALLEHTAAQC